MFSELLVIELASVLAGPSAGMFLAELGANVIKIENPNTKGDITRSWKHPKESSDSDITAYFSCANWGKYSVGLDITTKEGHELIHKLLEKADIVIVSYKPGDAEKLGMDYTSVKSINSSIIYASLTGYGNENPKTAFDAVLQAESGFMSMNGNAETGPLKMPVALIDVLAAHQLKEGILLALIKRLQIGEGSKVEVALFETAIASLVNQASNYLFTGEIPKAMGNEHPNIAPYGETFSCKDGRQIILAIGSDKQFKALCEILGIAEISEFADNQSRLENRELLKQYLEEKIVVWNSEELLQRIEAKKIPVGIVRNVAEALKATESAKLMLGKAEMQGISQLAIGGIGKSLPKFPPHFGEDTFSMLKLYTGLSESELIDLQENEIIFNKNLKE